MYKLVAILVALIPMILFLRTVFGRSQVMKQASSDLRRHVDYMVWAIVIIVVCAIVYSIVKLVHVEMRHSPAVFLKTDRDQLAGLRGRPEHPDRRG